MHALLSHPAIQGGLIPFIVALIVAELFQRMKLSGLAIIAGFAAMAYLANELSFDSFTSTRKIVFLGSFSALIALPLMLFNPRWMSAVLTVVCGCVTTWVVLGILPQQEITNMLLWAAGCVLYVCWLVFWFDNLNEASIRAGSAGLGLGLGSCAIAVFNASTLLGQYGLALGAASGAYLLIQMVTNIPLPCGRSFTLPLSLIAGLSGCVCVLTTNLPWYALLVLAVIPVIAKIPMPANQALWVQSVLLSVATLICVAGAVYLA